MEKYSISLAKLIEEFSLNVIYLPDSAENILVTSNEIDRPGLALAGFFEYFKTDRIKLIGNAEYRYLSRLDDAARKVSISEFLSKRPVAVLMTAGHKPFDEIVEKCEEFGVPLLGTADATSAIMAALIASLNIHLAPRLTQHGVLVEVYGEGILLLGDSGIGKSETAIELVKRGHRLIADDAVEIKRVSAKSVVGTAPDIIRHYVELRGIGIVDVRRLFGMGSVKMSEKIDLVVNLEPWEQGKMYDRLGLDDERVDILGISLPSLTIPVHAGRNLAIILEIAAMNNRQKKMGYNTADEFNKRLMAMMGVGE